MNQLRDNHVRELEKSCLSLETITRAGYYSTTYQLGDQELSCWAIDLFNPFTGNLITTRYRPDEPFNPKIKYLQPKGSAQGIYFSQLIDTNEWKSICNSNDVPILLVEGEKKNDCTLQYLTAIDVKYAAIGITGVWNWGKDWELNDLLQRFVTRDRRFTIIVDSDFKTNNNIKQAIYRLAEKLLDYDCKVEIVIVPGNPESPDKKFGVDDYLFQFAESDRSKELLKLISNSERHTKTKITKLATRINKKVKQEYRNQKPTQDGQTSSTFQQTAGQIILDRFFNSGVGYITYAGNLRKYNSSKGYYDLINEEQIKNSIANFFDNDIETSKYSKASTIKDALEYVKIKTYIDAEKINPPGLNVKNGYLRLSYDNDGCPFFALEQHTPSLYFTYCADVTYDSLADDSTLIDALDAMLDKKQQSVLLRTIAAQFDITKVRQKLSRIKVLLLLGNGSNGKDTVREWASILFSEGFTHVGLKAFQQADQGRTFGIFDLTRSRVNWSSENITIALDSCQSLKSASTGDPIQAEEKMKQGISFKAQCVLLFNINNLPKLEAQQEAIMSRYSVIHFPYIFKMLPDSSKTYEKQADPRLKEDPEFIRQCILPALLNRLLLEYQQIFTEDIDYSINPELMTEIKENSNHLLQFINERKLKECDPEQGLAADYVHKEYLNWCLQAGYIECDKDDSNDKDFHTKENSEIKKYHDPSYGDKIIRNPKEMGRRLRDVFPYVKVLRTADQRLLGLNFFSN